MAFGMPRDQTTTLRPKSLNPSRRWTVDRNQVEGCLRNDALDPLPHGRGRFGSSGCETDHWIDSVSSDGGIIKLEDGSIWQVNVIDRITSTLWLPISDIVACDDKLINTDDNESVEATRLR